MRVQALNRDQINQLKEGYLIERYTPYDSYTLSQLDVLNSHATIPDSVIYAYYKDDIFTEEDFF